MNRKVGVMASITMLLGACTATPPPASTSLAGACDAAPAQTKLGSAASQETGAELLRLTGARTLRWLAPGMAATMDFRPDRLSVSYDDKMVIERITCG